MNNSQFLALYVLLGGTLVFETLGIAYELDSCRYRRSYPFDIVGHEPIGFKKSLDFFFVSGYLCVTFILCLMFWK